MISANPNNSNSLVLLLTNSNFAKLASPDIETMGFQTVIEKIEEPWDKLKNYQPAMLIIDRDFAGELGSELCRHIRNTGSHLPILMLVNQETVEEKIACLEAGADDYLLKPYQRDKLLEQINLYLQPKLNVPEHLRFGDLILNLATRQVIRNDQVIDLTMKEFELLKYLMSNPQQVMTREEIIENVWGYNYRGESNIIEVYIRYLRLKTENLNNRRLIQTVRGIGYVLKES